jgi:hypothetical protein
LSVQIVLLCGAKARVHVRSGAATCAAANVHAGLMRGRGIKTREINGPGRLVRLRDGGRGQHVGHVSAAGGHASLLARRQVERRGFLRRGGQLATPAPAHGLAPGRACGRAGAGVWVRGRGAVDSSSHAPA